MGGEIVGDRALIHFVDEKEISPATYLHLGGDRVGELLRATFERMRTRGPDVAYTAARFVGTCHNWMRGNMSLAVWSAPDGGIDALRKPEYSEGNAGVFIVHLNDRGWEIEMHGGYGLHSIFLEVGVMERGRLLWVWQPSEPLSKKALVAETVLTELAERVTRSGSRRAAPGQRSSRSRVPLEVVD
jgi:hypothetical protein